MALVSVKKTGVHRLPEIGVRDSKLLQAKRREQIYGSITEIAEQVEFDRIMPHEINEAMKGSISLNELEAIHFSRLFDRFDSVSTLYLDSPDVIAEKFGMRINMLSYKPTKVAGIKAKGAQKGVKYTKLVAEHKADSRYPVVSAASIIAKVERDRWVSDFTESSGINFGSGYPSDNKTIEAIKQNAKDAEFNSYVRAYWKTLTNIKQTKLTSFPVRQRS